MNYSINVPFQYKCERCGTMLHGSSGGLVTGPAEEVIEYVRKKVKRCPACGKIFCGKCSIEVDKELGRPQGAVDFTCPFCRKTGI